MSSPHDKLSNPYYNSPYSRQSYPSMEEGFIPLSFSSPYKTDQGPRQRTTGTYKQQNWQNPYYKNRGQQQKKNFSHRSSFGNWDQNKSGDKRFYSRVSGSSDITDYLHPSMTEDPWKELTTRRQILGACELEEQTTEEAAGEGDSTGRTGEEASAGGSKEKEK